MYVPPHQLLRVLQEEAATLFPSTDGETGFPELKRSPRPCAPEGREPARSRNPRPSREPLAGSHGSSPSVAPVTYVSGLNVSSSLQLETENSSISAISEQNQTRASVGAKRPNVRPRPQPESQQKQQQLPQWAARAKQPLTTYSSSSWPAASSLGRRPLCTVSHAGGDLPQTFLHGGSAQPPNNHLYTSPAQIQLLDLPGPQFPHL